MHFGFMEVILFDSGHQHVSATYHQSEDGHMSGQNMLVTTIQ